MKKNKKTEIIADPDKLNQLSELGDSLINSVRNLGIDIDLIGDDERLLLQKLQAKKIKLANAILDFNAEPEKIELVRSNGNIDYVSWAEYEFQEPEKAKGIVMNNNKKLDSLHKEIDAVNKLINSLLHTTEVTIDTINKKFISTKGTILSSLTGSMKNLSESNKANIEANNMTNIDVEKLLKEIKKTSPELYKNAKKEIESSIIDLADAMEQDFPDTVLIDND